MSIFEAFSAHLYTLSQDELQLIVYGTIIMGVATILSIMIMFSGSYIYNVNEPIAHIFLSNKIYGFTAGMVVIGSLYVAGTALSTRADILNGVKTAHDALSTLEEIGDTGVLQKKVFHLDFLIPKEDIVNLYSILEYRNLLQQNNEHEIEQLRHAFQTLIYQENAAQNPLQ